MTVPSNDNRKEVTMTGSADKSLRDLYDLIDGIEIAMFTTRRPDGHLVSRPKATQTQSGGKAGGR